MTRTVDFSLIAYDAKGVEVHLRATGIDLEPAVVLAQYIDRELRPICGWLTVFANVWEDGMSEPQQLYNYFLPDTYADLGGLLDSMRKAVKDHE